MKHIKQKKNENSNSRTWKFCVNFVLLFAIIMYYLLIAYFVELDFIIKITIIVLWLNQHWNYFKSKIVNFHFDHAIAIHKLKPFFSLFTARTNCQLITLISITLFDWALVNIAIATQWKLIIILLIFLLIFNVYFCCNLTQQFVYVLICLHIVLANEVINKWKIK